MTKLKSHVMLSSFLLLLQQLKSRHVLKICDLDFLKTWECYYHRTVISSASHERPRREKYNLVPKFLFSFFPTCHENEVEERNDNERCKVR